MARTQKNKATEFHFGVMKARLAKLRSEVFPCVRCLTHSFWNPQGEAVVRVREMVLTLLVLAMPV